MNKKMQSTDRSLQKNNKAETKTPGKMRFFYILMLILTIFSLVLRVSGGRRGRAGQISAETTARALVFHVEAKDSCEDLVITATGGAVLSNCGNGMEKQYALNGSERGQLQAWVEQYSAVSYDHTNPSQAGGSKTQLYLNGRGSRQANEAEVQQLIDFADTLASKITSLS